jgi:hypothetical protein
MGQMVKRRFAFKMAILATAIGSALALGSTGYASAAQKVPASAAARPAAAVAEQCDLTLFCLNAWNGGPYVKTYEENGEITNNSFEMVKVDRCGNGDLTTSGCPGAGDPPKLTIFQIKDTNNGKCVGNSPGNGNLAYLGTCNETAYPGTGGANGTIFIAANPSSTNGNECFAIGGNYYINNYWTGQNGGWSNAVGMYWSPDANGSSVVLSGPKNFCIFTG